MNYPVLYQWQEEIANQLPCLNSWQTTNVALFSLGVMRAESCQQQQVAKAVVSGEQVESCTRRWRRYLDNKQFPLETVFGEWSAWVLSKLAQEKVYLLVDETKLQDRIGALVVGVAWQGRCIPLAWRCYVADEKGSYPPEGQVKVIEQLLKQIKAGINEAQQVVLMADRGIGNSSDLCRAVIRLEWFYLFRVTANSKVIFAQGKKRIVNLVQQGESCSVAGTIFSSTGGLQGWVHAIWQTPHDHPWALVTNDPALDGYEYARRNWQEQGFRDLKSGGWHWQISRIRHPDHMDRLLLLLAIAYGWTLALGSMAIHLGVGRKLIRQANGQLRRYWSLFKEGLAYFFEFVQRRGRFHSLCFLPDARFS